MENKSDIDLSKIEFIKEQVIEIDYDNFILYHVIDSDIWLAENKDQEICAEPIVIENPSEGLYFDGSEIFGTIISKEDFIKFKGLKYDDD